MKIIVFGGGGFIGSAVVDRLLRDEHTVRVFERPRVGPYRVFEPFERLEWRTGDIQSSHDLSEAVQDMDVVVHLVSTTLPKNSNEDPVYDVQTNVVASLQILNAMVQHGVKKIVFISSGGTVYGNPVYLPIDEKHPTEPLVSYGVTKLAIEKYLKIFSLTYGLQTVILRVANPYGERQRVETAQGAVGVFLHNALSGLPLHIWGDGSTTRDYIHVSDVAEAFLKAVNFKGLSGVFNISSGVGTSLNDLIGMLEVVLERSIERHYLPGRSIDVPSSVLANRHAQDVLMWSPSVSMSIGLARTALWMRESLKSRYLAA